LSSTAVVNRSYGRSSQPVSSYITKKRREKQLRCSEIVEIGTGGVVANAVPIFLTSAVKDGVCYSVAFWASDAAKLAYGIWYFVSFYAIFLLLSIFCYWRILIIIRRQANVMAKYRTPLRKYVLRTSGPFGSEASTRRYV